MLMTKLKIRTDVIISVHNERVDVYPKKGVQAAAAGMAVVPNRRSSSSGNVSGGSTSSVGGGPAAASKLVTSVVHSLGYKQESFNLDMVVDACVSHKPVPATDKIRYLLHLYNRLYFLLRDNRSTLTRQMSRATNNHRD